MRWKFYKDAAPTALLKFSGEGLLEERLLQRRQRGLLPFVERGEALGFFAEGVEV